MQTTLPPTTDGGGSSPVPEGATAPPPRDQAFGAIAFGVVLAALALVSAAVALVFAGDGGSSDTPGGASAGSATVELSEFALAPAALTVPAGGSLEVTNGGSAAHNLRSAAPTSPVPSWPLARAGRSTCRRSNPASTR